MAANVLIAIISLGLASSLIDAQVVNSGRCPKKVQALRDFEAQRYLGRWYEVQKYFFIFEAGGKCVTADYSLNDNGTIRVVNMQFNTFTNQPTSIKGEAAFVESPTVAKLGVSFPSAPINFAAPYWVVGTDYDSYALVWSCLDLGFLHGVNSWILTRDRNPDPSVLKKVYAIAEKNGIDTKSYTVTNQENCAT